VQVKECPAWAPGSALRAQAAHFDVDCPNDISLTPAAPSGRPEFQMTQGAALG